MGLIDKLNEWALKRIRHDAVERVEIREEGVTLVRSGGAQFIPWSEVQEIAVLQQPPLANGTFALAIHGAGNALAVVDDTVLGFRQLCAEIPHQFPSAVPYEEWTAELLAAAETPGKVIFRRKTV